MIRSCCVAERPAHRAGRFFDLMRTLCAAQRARDAGLADRPVDDELGDGVAAECGRFAQPIDEILVPLPLVAVHNGYVAAAVALVEFSRRAAACRRAGLSSAASRP